MTEQILITIQNEFAQAKTHGLVLASFIDSDGALNIGLDEDTEQQVIDRLMEHIRRTYKNVSCQAFHDDMQDCIALKISIKRPHLMMGKPQEIRIEDLEKMANTLKGKGPKGNMVLTSPEIYEKLEDIGIFDEPWLEDKPKKRKIIKKKVKKNDNVSTSSKHSSRSRAKGRKNISSKK